jgi:hypothetical protein
MHFVAQNSLKRTNEQHSDDENVLAPNLIKGQNTTICKQEKELTQLYSFRLLLRNCDF